jgi:hypothetical protein
VSLRRRDKQLAKPFSAVPLPLNMADWFGTLCSACSTQPKVCAFADLGRPCRLARAGRGSATPLAGCAGCGVCVCVRVCVYVCVCVCVCVRACMCFPVFPAAAHALDRAHRVPPTLGSLQEFPSNTPGPGEKPLPKTGTPMKPSFSSDKQVRQLSYTCARTPIAAACI